MPTKKSKKKAEKKPIEVKEPEVKKIKMLMSLANSQVAYTVGHTYEAGKDMSLEMARSLLKSGLAEEVKIPDIPEETK